MLAVTKVLLDDSLPSLGKIAGPDRSTAKTISDVRRAHASYWKCFQTDGAFPTSVSTSHRPSTGVIQRKRKRKDSDGEYTPHQKAESNQSTTSTARRTSKRLAASARLEQWPDTIISPVLSRSTVAKRSSSSTSALTTTSSSSFDRPLTPKELDTPDLPGSISKSKPKKSPSKRSPPPEIDWSDVDDFSDWSRRLSPSVKIGFPPKEKKATNDHSYSTSTSYHLIEVGDRLHRTPCL